MIYAWKQGSFRRVGAAVGSVGLGESEVAGPGRLNLFGDFKQGETGGRIAEEGRTPYARAAVCIGEQVAWTHVALGCGRVEEVHRA